MKKKTQQAPKPVQLNIEPKEVLSQESLPLTPPSEDKVETYSVRVTYTKVNIRQEPSLNSAIVTRVMAGEKLKISETKEINGYAWGYSDYYKGWIALEFTEKV